MQHMWMLRAAAVVGGCLLLGVVTVAPASSAMSPQVRPRVVNGTPISASDVPWQALVLVDQGDEQALCSGALISPTTILSVAHC
ncbi:MAG: trypsin-like serine protease, partial [Burkholderiaceae bacterium]|nr:trypsin-like serine protease [Burkholderiaceae bacterium]